MCKLAEPCGADVSADAAFCSSVMEAAGNSWSEL